MDLNGIWRILAIIVFCMLVTINTLYAFGLSWKDKSSDHQAPEKMLSLWTDQAELKKKLLDFVEAAVDEEDPDYIPKENRIAVFDLDGTLFCDTDPYDFDYTLLVYRVLEDPYFKDIATDFEREIANSIVERNKLGASFEGLGIDHGKVIASSFSGMTLGEFNSYIQEFKKMSMPSYTNMTRGDGWYRPMLQVVEYLQANDFTIYVISGTDRFIVRGIIDHSPLNVPESHIIGSVQSLVATNQGDDEDYNYTLQEDDKIILGGEFVYRNVKLNKVIAIVNEIGVQPVLSFGNSSGDSSMAKYVITNNPYPSLAFMVCNDDTIRENGNIEKANAMYDLCNKNGWIPISMKNDWTTIYGEGVTKKQQQQQQQDIT